MSTSVGGKTVYVMFKDGMLVGSDASGAPKTPFGSGFVRNIRYVAIPTKCNACGTVEASFAESLLEDVDMEVWRGSVPEHHYPVRINHSCGGCGLQYTVKTEMVEYGANGGFASLSTDGCQVVAASESDKALMDTIRKGPVETEG